MEPPIAVDDPSGQHLPTAHPNGWVCVFDGECWPCPYVSPVVRTRSFRCKRCGQAYPDYETAATCFSGHKSKKPRRKLLIDSYYCV